MKPVSSPHVLREYALLADGERGAIIGPAGDVVWLCVPHWHSGSLFSALIGGEGVYTISPVGPYVWGGYYEPGSLIWRSRWTTHDGQVECREALAGPPDPHCAVLLRRVCALDAPAHLSVTLAPRASYDRHPMQDLRRENGVWTGRVGPLRMRWQGADRARPTKDDTALHLELDLPAGGEHDFAFEISDRALAQQPPDPDRLWTATESHWADAADIPSDVLDPNNAKHSYAVLRGLTSRDGGMVAAATTSLPERAEAGRNYDYRYVWIRDQCYVGLAAAGTGLDALLDAAVNFVSNRVLEHGDRLSPAYTVTGEPMPTERRLSLPGYPGGHNVIGNRARDQFQLDSFGEALNLLAAAARRDRLEARHWDAARAAADSIGRRWQEPDAGIWEIDPRAWTHSRLTAASGLRSMAAARPQDRDSRDHLALADRIIAETSKTALHPDGRWQRAPDDPAVDAALLLPSLRGVIPSDDPRTIATLRAYMDELTVDGYAYRFRQDDRPLADGEGSFLLCGFLVALALHQQGDHISARAWYERTSAACGPPRLFSEEYDAIQYQMRGNLPQAFVHALMLQAAHDLAPT